MGQRCLMGVFAHPDGESFGCAGSFRKYADESVRIALVTATRGEEGEISDLACFPEQIAEGLEPYAPQKLYALAFPREGLAQARHEMQKQGIDFTPGGTLATIPAEQIGATQEEITTSITLTEEEREAKKKALRAHATQMQPNGIANRLPPEALNSWLGTERFILLVPPGASGYDQEHDLFADVQP